MNYFFRLSVKYANTYEHFEIRDSGDLPTQVDSTRRVVSTNIYEHLLRTDSKADTTSISQNLSTNTYFVQTQKPIRPV